MSLRLSYLWTDRKIYHLGDTALKMTVVDITGWSGSRRVFYRDGQSFLLDHILNNLKDTSLPWKIHQSQQLWTNRIMNKNTIKWLTCIWSYQQLVLEASCNSSSLLIFEEFSDQNLVDSWWNWVYLLWCLSFQRGVGIHSTGMRQRCSIGNITQLLNWTFLFMIPASPLWIHWAAVQETSTSSQGDKQ